jgi:hypothetical protein
MPHIYNITSRIIRQQQPALFLILTRIYCRYPQGQKPERLQMKNPLRRSEPSQILASWVKAYPIHTNGSKGASGACRILSTTLLFIAWSLNV